MLLRRALVVLLVILLFLPPSAWALIEIKLPLEAVLSTSDCIAVASVIRFNEPKTIAVLEITRQLKGKAPAQRFSVDLISEKPDVTQQLLARIDIGTPFLCFITDQSTKEKPNNIQFLTFTNGTWSNISGEKTPNGIRWKFLHHEIYLRRTFKGTTEELQKVVVDVLAGKAKAPPLDNKEKPGLGPELMK